MANKIGHLVVIFCGLILLPLTALAGEPPKSVDIPLENQPREFLQHVVWNRKYQLVPHFLPAPVLQQEGIRGLSIENDVAASLENFLDRRRREREAQEPTTCTSSSETSFADQESPHSQTMVERLSSNSLVARGKVHAVVPGWALTRVMTMVYVEIEEILHCSEEEPPGRSVSLGAVVAGLMEVGSFELEGLTLCSKAPEGFIMPKVGDEVVVVGWPYPQDPYFIGRSIPLFPVREDVVLPQPYTNYKWDSVPLETLRSSLNGPHAECREGL